MDNLVKLQNIIKDSSLSDKDKEFWNGIFSMEKIPHDVIESLLEYMEANSDDVVWFMGFLKRKFTAFESSDKEALYDILKEEKQKLNSFK